MSVSNLNNVASQDNYADATTLKCPGTTKVRLTVANAAIYVQFAAPQGLQFSGQWQQEEYVIPTIDNRNISCSGVRFRSAMAGVPAQVTIAAQ